MKALIIGCGPGGERWQRIREEIEPDLIVAVNSSIVDVRDDADVFLCAENLGLRPEINHPWIATETRALKLINYKTLTRMGVEYGNDPSYRPYYRPRTPLVYPDSGVGTALYYALHEMVPTGLICNTLRDPIASVHLCGFPLHFVAGIQHWTEPGKRPYSVNASYYMPSDVFVTVNGTETIWQFAMSAAYVRRLDWPFEITHHGPSLLNHPGIENLFTCERPDRRDYVTYKETNRD